MYRQALALAPLFAMSACFNPTSGDYTFEEVESSTDCPEVEDTGSGEGEAEPTAVAVNEDKTTMVIGEGEGAYDCTMDGKSFTCPMDPFETDLTGSGIDYVSTITFDISGSWTSNTSFDMTVVSDITCEGADCETYNGVNCSSTATGEATLVE